MDNYGLGEIVLTGFEFKDNAVFYTNSITGAKINYLFNIPENKHVRIDDTVFASGNQKDIIVGYDISLTNALFTKDLFMRLQNLSEPAKKIKKYNKPEEKFNLIIYCAERDEKGLISGYFSLKFNGCNGSPLKILVSEDAFLISELLIKCRADNKNTMLNCSFCNNLPI